MCVSQRIETPPRSPATTRSSFSTGSPVAWSGIRASISTISRPTPCVAGARRSARPRISSRESRSGGQDGEQDPVPLEALVRRAAGLEPAHARERLVQHALELRELHDAAGGVAHRREIADLGRREEPLVLRVPLRDRRGRGTRPPPTGAARGRTSRAGRAASGGRASGGSRGSAGPRVHAAVAAEREVLLARPAPEAAAPEGDHHRDAPRRPWPRHRRERGPERLGLRVLRERSPVVPEVELARERALLRPPPPPAARAAAPRPRPHRRARSRRPRGTARPPRRSPRCAHGMPSRSLDTAGESGRAR